MLLQFQPICFALLLFLAICQPVSGKFENIGTIKPPVQCHGLVPKVSEGEYYFHDNLTYKLRLTTNVKLQLELGHRSCFQVDIEPNPKSKHPNTQKRKNKSHSENDINRNKENTKFSNDEQTKAQESKIQLSSLFYMIEYASFVEQYPVSNSYIFGIPELSSHCRCDCFGGDEFCSPSFSDNQGCSNYNKGNTADFSKNEICANQFHAFTSDNGCSEPGDSKLCCTVKVRPFKNRKFTAIHFSQPIPVVNLVISIYALINSQFPLAADKDAGSSPMSLKWVLYKKYSRMIMPYKGNYLHLNGFENVADMFIFADANNARFSLRKENYYFFEGTPEEVAYPADNVPLSGPEIAFPPFVKTLQDQKVGHTMEADTDGQQKIEQRIKNKMIKKIKDFHGDTKGNSNKHYNQSYEKRSSKHVVRQNKEDSRDLKGDRNPTTNGPLGDGILGKRYHNERRSATNIRTQRADIPDRRVSKRFTLLEQGLGLVNSEHEYSVEKLGWLRYSPQQGAWFVRNAQSQLMKIHNPEVNNCQQQRYLDNYRINTDYTYILRNSSGYNTQDGFEIGLKQAAALSVRNTFIRKIWATLNPHERPGGLVVHASHQSVSAPNLKLDLALRQKLSVIAHVHASYATDFSAAIRLDSNSHRFLNLTLINAYGAFVVKIYRPQSANNIDVVVTISTTLPFATNHSELLPLPAHIAQPRYACIHPARSPQRRMCKMIPYEREPLKWFVMSQTFVETEGNCPGCNIPSISGGASIWGKLFSLDWWGSVFDPGEWFQGANSFTEVVAALITLLSGIFVLLLLIAVVRKILCPLGRWAFGSKGSVRKERLFDDVMVKPSHIHYDTPCKARIMNGNADKV